MSLVPASEDFRGDTMARFDRKRWWEQRPTPPKPRYFGIVAQGYIAWEENTATNSFIPKIKPHYLPVRQGQNREYYLDDKLTEHEAKALCAILNAAEEANGHG